MSGSDEQYIESLIAQFPSQTELLQRIYDTRKKRLWHQLTEAVLQYIHVPEVRQVEHFPTFYDIIIRDIAPKMNPLSHAHIAVETTKQIQGADQKLQFLQNLPSAPSHTDDSEARIMLNSNMAELKVALGNIEEASKDIDNLEFQLDSLTSTDSSVYASFYKAKALILKSKGYIVDFYKTGLQYLAYAQMETVDKQERAALAFDLALAALVGDEVYNFGDLIEKQILDALDGTPNHWLALIVDCFNKGDFNRWVELQNQYSEQMNSIPELIHNKQILQQKISILALIEYIFNQSEKNSTVSFQTISEVSRVPLNDVELLLMKAISIGLLKGKIDQVMQHIVIDWIQPRVLSLEQINKMKERLTGWKANVRSALELVEDHLTPELLS